MCRAGVGGPRRAHRVHTRCASTAHTLHELARRPRSGHVDRLVRGETRHGGARAANGQDSRDETLFQQWHDSQPKLGTYFTKMFFQYLRNKCVCVCVSQKFAHFLFITNTKKVRLPNEIEVDGNLVKTVDNLNIYI